MEPENQMPPGMRNTAIGGQNIEVANASFIVPKGALSFACANCLLYHFSPNPQCIASTKANVVNWDLEILLSFYGRPNISMHWEVQVCMCVLGILNIIIHNGAN